MKNSNNHSDIKTLDANVLKVLDEFVKDHKLDRKDNFTTSVFLKELDELNANNCSVELLLNYLAGNYGSLFYGSPQSITGYENGYQLKPNGNGIICCTNLGAAAILNALIKKEKLTPPGIKIPSNMDLTQAFRVEIYGLNKEALSETGFIYIVNNKDGFEKMTPSLWQFKNTTGNPVHVNAKIPVTHYDFKHTINDISRCKEIRLDVDFRRKYY